MLNGTHLTKAFRDSIWAQCAKTVTHLESILVSVEGEKNVFGKFYSENPYWIASCKILDRLE
jgi:hypothetical protein